jgi:hypothetical protein
VQVPARDSHGPAAARRHALCAHRRLGRHDTKVRRCGDLRGPCDSESDFLRHRLYEISSRLQSIEAALRIKDGTHHSPGVISHNSYDRHLRSPSPHSSEDGEATDDNASVGRAAADAANPLHEINATIDQIQGTARTPKYPFMQSNDYGAPDALRRGLLTAEECQQLFDFFFASLHPWVMMLSLDEDRDPLVVRSRSSLLFHTILLLSTAYSSPFPSQLHLTLVTFLNAIIAPQLLNPQPHELTTDFLRAIDLLNLYKPTQLVSRRAEGMDTTEAMRASKVNGLASWMLQGILARTAERLDLKETVPRFARAHSASANGTPIPKDLVRDLRYAFGFQCGVATTARLTKTTPCLFAVSTSGFSATMCTETCRAGGAAIWKAVTP